MTANPLTDTSRWTFGGPPRLLAADVWLDHDGRARPLTERGRDVLAELDDPALVLRAHRPHWDLEDPVYAGLLIFEHDKGRHRAEDIGPDITIETVARFRAYKANCKRTRHTGHLGTRPRHECRCRRCVVDRTFVTIAAAYKAFDEALGPW